MLAVAQRDHGDLAQQLDAGLLSVSSGQVDGDGSLHSVVVFVAIEEAGGRWGWRQSYR